MPAEYKDITSRIAEAPTWWDENGTPRYGDFTPNARAHLDTYEVVLFEIECHNCQTRLKVTLSSKNGTLAEQIKSGTLFYGDPPRGCESDQCIDGSTIIRILQYWRIDSAPKDFLAPWVRDSEYEIAFCSK